MKNESKTKHVIPNIDTSTHPAQSDFVNYTSPAPKKTGSGWMKTVGIVVALIIIGAINNTSNHTTDNKEVGNIIQDSIKNTHTASPQNAQYVELMKQVMSYFKTQSKTFFPDAESLNDETFLTYDSFKAKAEVERRISSLNNLIVEENNFENNFQKMNVGLKAIINNSNLSSTDKADVIHGLEKRLNDPKSTEIRKKFITALINLTTNESSLYIFLDNNFNDYIIRTDSKGKENIEFYTDSNITIYNQLMASIKSSKQIYSDALSEYDANTNTNLNQYGVSTNDAKDYFNK